MRGVAHQRAWFDPPERAGPYCTWQYLEDSAVLRCRYDFDLSFLVGTPLQRVPAGGESPPAGVKSVSCRVVSWHGCVARRCCAVAECILPVFPGARRRPFTVMWSGVTDA